MKTSGKIGSNGVYMLDNVEKHFETNMYIHTAFGTVISYSFVCRY